jgi:putative hemolysin
MNSALMLALFLVLLALTAFFNLAEMALVAARAARLENGANSKAADHVLNLKRQPGLFLAAIRAGDLLTDLLMGAFVVTWIEDLLRAGLRGLPFIGSYASAFAGCVAFIVLSYVILVFADLAPKSIALGAPERAAMAVISPLRLLIQMTRPFCALLEVSNNFVLRILGVKPQSEDRVTEEEIRSILSKGLSAGVLLSFERSMMERVLDLDRRSVRSVMTGRRYIQFLQKDSNAEQLRAAVLEATASILPVTDQSNLDQLIGMVSRADVLATIATGEGIDLAAMATTPTYIAESASVLSALETLKSTPSHMVVVVDEFGSLMGLVTLADVLEAVAGDVTAEDDPSPEERLLGKETDGSYLVCGDQPVDDIIEAQLLPAPVARNYKTMAGLIIDRLRRIPNEGEVVEFPTLRIEVIRIEQGAVKNLRIIPKQGGRA